MVALRIRLTALPASLLFVAVLSASSPAHGQPIDESNGLQWGLLAAATVTGLVNTVGTIVYMAQNRSFDTGWVVSSFFSTAACGAFGVALVADATTTGQDGGRIPVALGFFTLALVPGAWAVRGAVDEASPGERFDPTRRQREAQLDRTTLWTAPPRGELVVGFPPLRF